MRSLLAGLLILLMPACAAAQVSGSVEKIGFGGLYRPDCWTPMVVQLVAGASESPATDYVIEVHQQDMDKDVVLYARRVTLNANAKQRYWVYFRPSPAGLPETQVELQKALSVRLCDVNGKELAVLPFPITPIGFDVGHDRPGNKMILAVSESGTSRLSINEYQPAADGWVPGLMEDVTFVNVRPIDLPENAIGYEAVDGVVWLDADAAELEQGLARKLPALEEYVRKGGRLVVCQPAMRERILPLRRLLPIQLKDTAGNWLVQVTTKPTTYPLPKLAARRGDPPRARGWQLLTGPFPFAAASRPTADAIVDEWISDWPPSAANAPAAQSTPFLARHAVGAGLVVWVAADLSDPKFTKLTGGWPHVWDRVFGWRNDPYVPGDLEIDGTNSEEQVKRRYSENAGVCDVGAALLGGMDHPNKTGAYTFLAIFFFIGYWLIAGPGSYLLLLGKKRTHWSWPAFTVASLVATLVTIVLIRFILGGSAEVKHVSIVRIVSPDPASNAGSVEWNTTIDSRIGLYIPKDGAQHIELKDASPAAASSFITALPIHPRQVGDVTGFGELKSYQVAVQDAPLTDAIAIDVPYRSTLKKFQSFWTGTLPSPITGRATVLPAAMERDKDERITKGTIDGILINTTGTKLRNVYVAFLWPGSLEGASDTEYVVYVAEWEAGKPLDLARIYNDVPASAEPVPNASKPVRARLLEWATSWTNPLREHRSSFDSSSAWSDEGRAVPIGFPVLSLFDRLGPIANESLRPGESTRVELARRGGRGLDLSHLLGAGRLIVLAQANGAPLPAPLDVQGDRMTGDGTTFYQFILPLDRTEFVKASAAQPQ